MCKNTSTQLQEFHSFKAWPSELRAKLFSCSAKGDQTHAHLCPKGHHGLSDPHQEGTHQPSCSTFSLPCMPNPQVRHCPAGCFFFSCAAFPTQERVPISSMAASNSSKYTLARGSPSYSCPSPPAPLGQEPLAMSSARAAAPVPPAAELKLGLGTCLLKQAFEAWHLFTHFGGIFVLRRSYALFIYLFT